jgi:hypothetical protein
VLDWHFASSRFQYRRNEIDVGVTRQQTRRSDQDSMYKRKWSTLQLPRNNVPRVTLLGNVHSISHPSKLSDHYWVVGPLCLQLLKKDTSMSYQRSGDTSNPPGTM